MVETTMTVKVAAGIFMTVERVGALHEAASTTVGDNAGVVRALVIDGASAAQVVVYVYAAVRIVETSHASARTVGDFATIMGRSVMEAVGGA